MSSNFVPLSRLLSEVQPSLFTSSHTPATTSLAVTPLVTQMLSAGCAVAIGVSGGKDSQACALRTAHYLDELGHNGPRVLVHADLGAVEWRDSLPSCQRLALHLGLELIVVRRKAGGMLPRWRKRWISNVARYRELSCVRLILPWSTPSMRYCTSELKVAPITSELKRRYPDRAILNVSGIRRQESAARSRKPIAALESRLRRKKYDGATWNPIIDWTLDDVLAEIQGSGLCLHEAYTKYGSSRVSCAFCIMSSVRDLQAATTCCDNHDVYRAMVELEADSTFAFQGTRWLADVAPLLLPFELRHRIDQAKKIGQLRQAIEAEIPNHLLYTKGWPTSIPTVEEATLVAGVRRRISELLGLDAMHTTAESVRARYVELLEEKRARETKSGRRRKCR